MFIYFGGIVTVILLTFEMCLYVLTNNVVYSEIRLTHNKYINILVNGVKWQCTNYIKGNWVSEILYFS